MSSENEILITNATIDDLDELHGIESASFSPGRAAGYEAFSYRLKAYPQWFFKAVADGKIIGLLNGASSDRRYITDDLYIEGGAFDEHGENFLIYGIAVLPEYRRKGIAHKLISRALSIAKERGKTRVSLTCKEELVGFYESFGFIDHGISESVAGNVISHDMEIDLY